MKIWNYRFIAPGPTHDPAYAELARAGCLIDVLTPNGLRTGHRLIFGKTLCQDYVADKQKRHEDTKAPEVCRVCSIAGDIGDELVIYEEGRGLEHFMCLTEAMSG